MLKNNLEEIHEGVSKFLNKLNYDDFSYFSNSKETFDTYNLPRLGNSCYAIKLKNYFRRMERYRFCKTEKVDKLYYFISVS